jgi:hypothetical protein
MNALNSSTGEPYTFSSTATEVARIADWIGDDSEYWQLVDDLRRCVEGLEAAAAGRYNRSPAPTRKSFPPVEHLSATVRPLTEPPIES